jgi:hypothetical protein
MYLPGIEPEAMYDPGKVIDNLLDCLSAFNQNPETLQELIPDTTYRRNFVALAEKLAPDGDRIRLVGLTAQRPEGQKKVLLTRAEQEATSAVYIEKPRTDPPSKVEGTLAVANSKSKEKKIELKRDDGSWLTVVVPDGMMDDIVRPLWAERVQVIGVVRGKKLLLDRIRKVRRRTPQTSGKDDSSPG